ncbi:YVTN family beta-propeller protein [Aneurinibacillus soli]|uniref:Uncharacterized protein n=1 Tax=Aneurinibacillus soli TaxID=1500254 RepID=A0A0U5AW13_9BACL|nr:hypothetical protein [Aneurinibacillus soli]PYE58198.1 YVTN family beta-propeller protein [Aneurinibacillus soli]BAU27914.1 hypothetical protein CB4_02088 [Aneurinibacillus soli]
MKGIQMACLTSLLLFLAIGVTGCGFRSFAAVPLEKDVLIVASTQSRMVSFLQADTGEVLAQWKPSFAFNRLLLLPDHHSVLLYHKNEEQAHVIDMRDGQEKAVWKIGTGIVNAVASADGKTIYLADRDRGMVRFYGLDGQERAAVKVGSYPLTIIPDSNGKWIYVYDLHEAKGYTVDAKAGRVTRTFAVNESPMGGLFIPKRQELWVGGHGEGDVPEESITVLNAVTGQKQGEIQAPSMPVEFVQYNEDTVFVLSHGSSTLRRIRVTDRAVTGTLPLGTSPFGMAAGREHLYISSFEGGQVYVVDPKQMKVIKTVRVGGGPMQLFVREGGQS